MVTEPAAMSALPGSGRVEQLAQAVAERVVNMVMDAIDIDALLERIDVDALVARVDVDAVVSRLRPLAHVVSVTGPFSAAGAHQVAADGHTAYAVVQFDTTSNLLPAAAVHAVINTAEAAAHPGFAVALGGNPISSVITAAPTVALVASSIRISEPVSRLRV